MLLSEHGLAEEQAAGHGSGDRPRDHPADLQ